MKVVCDIEANALVNPTHIWVVVCKDIDTGELHIFREVTTNALEKERLQRFAEKVTLWIGHNFLEYDAPVLASLADVHILPVSDTGNLGVIDSVPGVIDTLIVSRLVDYPRDGGHSIEQYGDEFGLPKGIPIDGELLPSKYFPKSFFLQYSQDMEDYCIRDVHICHRIYQRYLQVISDPAWAPSLALEHSFQLVVNSLHNSGFYFNTVGANSLLGKVTKELEILDKEILNAFPPKEVLIREFTPRATKFGSISRTSVPRSLHERILEFEIGKVYRHCRLQPFNPASHKQIIEVLNEAGWNPTDKTKTHVETERELNKLKRSRNRDAAFDITLQQSIMKLQSLKRVGWKVNETNLNTLPTTAPLPARTLAKRILLESRRRTLTEWLDLVSPENRIHGKFVGIGAWTHRMAHQKPNTANIPNTVKVSDGSKVLLGKEMRSLWCAPKGRLLVGVDAEAIQLRVFAHLINDPALTDAIVNGKKSDKTDPHSLNQQYFGKFCKTRNAAKHSLYAMFFGGGPNMIAHIMACEREEAEKAIDSLISKYPGLAKLQQEVFPLDAKRGYFIGLDGRQVKIPGETESQRKHLCMSGYLQNGEKVIMAKASVRFNPQLKALNSFLVDLVHDEWQTETPSDMEIALKVARLQVDSLRIVGEELKMNCPLAGSYWSDDLEDYTIATNWAFTH